MHKASFRLFLFILIFSPLAFGTVETWSYMVMEAGIFIALGLYLAGHGKNNLYAVPGAIPLVLLLAYIFFQMVPLPAGLVKILSPSSYTLYEETAGAFGQLTWIPLTVNVKATLATFLRLASYAACYFLTVQLLTRKDLLRTTVTVVIVFAALMATCAILQRFISPRTTMFWFREIPLNATPTGPYVYHNAYAGLMEMIVPIVLALFFHYRPHTVTKHSLRSTLVHIFDQHRTNIHILLGFTAVLLATSIFVSLSRGGIISLSLAVLFLLRFFSTRETNNGSGLALFFITLTVLAVGWFGWDMIFTRFAEMHNEQGTIENSRFIFWQDSNHIIGDFTLFGSGLGTFLHIYSRYRTFPGDAIVDHAHNDYIELLTDGGTIAVVLVACFLVSLFRKSYHGYIQRREPYTRYLYGGCLAGMVALLIHSAVDFNFHIGANGLYFFFLAGLAVSAAHTRLRGSLSTTRLQPSKNNPKKFLFFASILLALICIIFQFGVMWSKYIFAPFDKMTMDREIDQGRLVELQKTAQRAATSDPFEARYRFALANASTFLNENDLARQTYAKSLQLNPTNSEYLQTAGLFLAGLHDDGGEKLLEAATRYGAMEPERYRRYGAWLLASNRKASGIEQLNKAIALEPDKTDSYINLMVLYRLTDEEIRTALPEKSRPLSLFGRYLEILGKDVLADQAFRDSVAYIHNEEKIQAWYFHPAYWYFQRGKKYQEAMDVIKEAASLFPDHPGTRFALGYAHEKLGEYERAQEEYRQTLVLEPGQKDAVKGMERMNKRNIK